jgi:hypothetical protein
MASIGPWEMRHHRTTELPGRKALTVSRMEDVSDIRCLTFETE